MSAQLQAFTCFLQAFLGEPSFFHEVAANYSETPGTQAINANSEEIVIPASSTNNVLNFATLFPAVTVAKFLMIQDISSAGVPVSVGLTSGGTRFPMNALGFFAVRCNGALPTMYIDNATTSAAVLQVVVVQ